MTGSWDRSLRFWDMRQLPTISSLATINLPERVWCSDMIYPLAVVGMANRHIKSYNLEGQPFVFLFKNVLDFWVPSIFGFGIFFRKEF